jgi:hypothetical protein
MLLSMRLEIFFCIAIQRSVQACTAVSTITTTPDNRSTSPRLDYGLGRVCLVLWFLNHVSLRMLVHVPVRGMQEVW